jgi:tetratricopeptide (TPR) repeat protein
VRPAIPPTWVPPKPVRAAAPVKKARPAPPPRPIASDISQRTFYAFCAIVFALALLLRIVHLWEVRDVPLFQHLVGDAEVYDVWGLKLASGQWFAPEVYYQAPLYPYFLGVIYKVVGHVVLEARMVQSIFGSAACVLLMFAGREIFSRTVGVIAGVLLALYPTAIFFDGLIQKSVLDGLFTCLLLYLIGAVLNKPTWKRWIGMGATLGAFVLTRENAGVLIIVLPIWIWVHFREHPPIARVKWIAAVVVTGIVMILPVTIRNAVIGGEFHLTTAQLGPNLYMGNSPIADGSYVPLKYGHSSPRYERIDATEIAEEALRRKLTPAEVSQYWTDRAVRFITTEPGRWLALMGKKFWLFWNATEMGDTEDQYTYADWSKVLRVLNPVLNFGLLCALASAGIALTAHQWRRLWVFYAIIGTYAASVIAFYVMARYRYPLIPILILFAGAAIETVITWIRQRRWEKNPAIAAAIAMVCVAFFTLGFSKNRIRATTYNNIGTVLYEHDDPEGAFKYYSKARTLFPDDPALNLTLGRILFDQKKYPEAIRYFADAVRLAPDYAPAHVALGAAMLEVDQLDPAAVEFGYALKLEPTNSAATDGMEQVRVAKARRATPAP